VLEQVAGRDTEIHESNWHAISTWRRAAARIRRKREVLGCP
jgi:hypothetical protein